MSNLIQNLQNASIYPHPVKYFKVQETHASWVILTGDFAYKIKKSVKFGFGLDYETLAARKHYCEEELLLNKKTAPFLYNAVLPITGSIDKPEINGAGPVIEYALQMKEFPQTVLFSELIEHDGISLQQIDALAEVVAHFHQQATICTDEQLGTAAAIHKPVLENFSQMVPFLEKTMQLLPEEKKQHLQSAYLTIAHVKSWAEQQYSQNEIIHQQRKRNGCIRACHGDLYLKNILLWENQPTLVDCIEFTDELRWIDVCCDIAFLLMDLIDHQRPDFANTLLTRYLEITGDYEMLSILYYYQTYRAMVRTKVAIISVFQKISAGDDYAEDLQDFYHYLNLANEITKFTVSGVVLMYGYSGSGKSTLAHLLTQLPHFVQIRSDVERKRLAGLPTFAPTPEPLKKDLYGSQQTADTYQRLIEITEIGIQAGFVMIVDATFLKLEQRQPFLKLAQQHHVPWVILHCDAPVDFLQERIKERRGKSGEPSDADLNVLTIQLQTREALTEEELTHTIYIDAHQLLHMETDAFVNFYLNLVGQIDERLHG